MCNWLRVPGPGSGPAAERGPMTRHLPLYAVVSASGASVLAVEILGTRILGPYYGVSLFLWSALITVTLAALSVGYAVGGRWADRGPRYSRLALVLAGAGVWLLVVPWIKGPALKLLEPAGLRFAVLIAATILFFPPLVLLGMVSPYAIRLRTESLDEVGRSAGDIYAVSTVASVAAALLTGFVLIPEVGVTRLVYGIGALLVLAALIAVVAGREKRGAVVAVFLLLLVAGGTAGIAPGERPDPKSGLLSLTESPYMEIRVIEDNGVRALLLDGGCHTYVDASSMKTLYPYVMVLDIVRLFYSDPGRMLLVGLGGGSVAKSYHAAGWDVDVAEIDPDVVETAREWFDLRPQEASITVMDGRRYLYQTDKRYDLVILDAFGSSAIPFHLVTREMFALVKSRLNPGGVLAMNVEARDWHDILVHSLAATLKTEFSTVIALPVGEPPNVLGNVVLLAADRPLDLEEGSLGNPYEFLGDDYWHTVVVQRNHAWANRFVPLTDGIPVLTDDHDPVALWAERINLVARRQLHTAPPWRHLAY
jgi:spermidine synthase